jgi:DNA polymerase-3 subunit delta
LERITLFVGRNKIVELADVEEAVAETTQRSVFEFTDALGNKDKKRAMLILKNLVDNAAQPIMILAMVARHFRLLIKAKEVEKWGAGREIASYLGVNSFFVKNYVNQAANFSLEELKSKFKLLAKCDRQIKSSRIPKERILEQLII